MRPDAKHANRFWGQKPLPKSKVEFFDAVTTPAPAGDGTVATIRMYGPIDSWGGYWGISTKDVGEVLDALPESVTQIVLRINSPGGEVFEGVSILNMLRAHRATVTAVVDGLAASAASFIAAGCDETVMSPGTQMMIHSPWIFAYGSASELRKTADTLDGIEASIIEIYTAKAGEQDWSALLAEDTWLTAAQTVEMGLADRVAVIPDAGETRTAGEADDEELVVIPDEDEPEDSAAARVLRLVARAGTSHNRLPSSTEPGDQNRKDEAVAYSDLTAGLRQRLGVTDAAASDEQLLAAVDEALEERVSTNTTVPEGVVMIDAGQLQELRQSAAEGAQARAEQNRQRREAIVHDAIRTGRISAAQQDTWRAALERDEEGASALLATLQPNTIPVAEIGHSDDIESAEDREYSAIFGAPKGA